MKYFGYEWEDLVMLARMAKAASENPDLKLSVKCTSNIHGVVLKKPLNFDGCTTPEDYVMRLVEGFSSLTEEGE